MEGNNKGGRKMKKVGQIIGSIFLPAFAWVSASYLSKSLLGTVIFGGCTLVVWILLLRSFTE